MGWTAEQKREKRAADAAAAAAGGEVKRARGRPKKVVEVAPTLSAFNDRPAQASLPTSTDVHQIVAAQTQLIVADDWHALDKDQPHTRPPPAPASPAARKEAHDSLLRRMQHARRHWEACKAFALSMLPSREVYDAIHSQRARSGGAPLWPPWNEMRASYALPDFPQITGVCEECIDAFIAHGQTAFEPCDACIRFEAMLCAAGGAFPSRA